MFTAVTYINIKSAWFQWLIVKQVSCISGWIIDVALDFLDAHDASLLHSGNTSCRFNVSNRKREDYLYLKYQSSL